MVLGTTTFLIVFFVALAVIATIIGFRVYFLKKQQ